MALDHLSQVMVLTIEGLEKTKLYTGAQAAATWYHPNRFPEEYRQLGKKIWQLANARKKSDLRSWPDNCECTESGLPLLQHTRKKATIVLCEGEETPRWQGNTLHTALNDEERQFLHIHRLTRLLSDYAYRKIEEIEEEPVIEDFATERDVKIERDKSEEASVISKNPVLERPLPIENQKHQANAPLLPQNNARTFTSVPSKKRRGTLWRVSSRILLWCSAAIIGYSTSHGINFLRTFRPGNEDILIQHAIVSVITMATEKMEEQEPSPQAPILLVGIPSI